MDIFFIALSSIALFQSIFALFAAGRFARYCTSRQLAQSSRHRLKAVIIVPCKGLEDGIEENLRALLTQDYPHYEIIFVTESEKDPAYQLISRIIKQSKQNKPAAWLLVAGEAANRGQKVQNLSAAIEMLNSFNRSAEVLVFADSDARVSHRWLRDLIAPLQEDDLRIGATTGYRWYLPVRGGFNSFLLTVWNSSALSLLGERSRFAWGGGMAIRRDNFDLLEILARWKGSLSDDYTLSAAVKGAGKRIMFIPQCLAVTFADMTLAQLIEFTTRQMRITRVYSPGVWKLATLTHVLYNLAFWGGLLWLIGSALIDHINEMKIYLLGILGVIFICGVVTGAIRALSATNFIQAEQRGMKIRLSAYAFLGPLVSLVYLTNIILSAINTRITWRGISYQMISPSETVRLSRPVHENSTKTKPLKQKKRKSSVPSSSQ
jgi:ceramide glucosyltransferase